MTGSVVRLLSGSGCGADTYWQGMQVVLRHSLVHGASQCYVSARR